MSKFDDFLQKHKLGAMPDNSFLPSVDDLALRINKLENDFEIPIDDSEGDDE